MSESIEPLDPEPEERVGDWVTEVYGPAVEIIAKTLMDDHLPVGPTGAGRVARTILAKLAQAEPPLTVALLSSAGAKGAAEELLQATEGVHEAFIALGPEWLVNATYGFPKGEALMAALIRMRTAIIEVKEAS
jgi:hypothetical protein